MGCQWVSLDDDAPFHLGADRLALGGLLAEVVADDIAHVVFLLLWRDDLGLRLEGLEAAIALREVVERGDAVGPLRVDGLACELGGEELPLGVDDELQAVADPLAPRGGYLPKQFHHLLAREGEEADFVFKRRHVDHIAVGHLALGEGGADAPHVVDSEVGLFAVFLAAPDEDVGEQVGEVALRFLRPEVGGGTAHDGAHHAVDHLLVGLEERLGLGTGRQVVAMVHEDAGALDGRHPVVRGAGRANEQQRKQEDLVFVHIPDILCPSAKLRRKRKNGKGCH